MVKSVEGQKYLEGSRTPVTEEVTAYNLPVTGQIPEELEGRWLRNGPNPYGSVDPATYHWFLGDGMIHGVRLRDGKAEWYRNRWVRGTDLAKRLGEEPPGGKCFRGSGFSPNTSVIGHNGLTLALVEAGISPVSLTYDLETIGYTNFEGTLPGAFTAHTKFDPIAEELHGVCYAYPDIPDRVQHVIVGMDNRVTKVTDIPIEGMPMIHDMSLTEKYALIYDLPVCVNIEMAMAGKRFPFAWSDEHEPRVGLLPRDGEAKDIIWCEAPKCYVFHAVNAFDLETSDGNSKVVVDLCRFDRMFYSDLHGPDESIPKLARWTIDPSTRTISEEIVSEQSQDFPTHDPRVVARKHRYAYTSWLGSGSTCRTDMETGEIIHHDHGEGRFGGEPLFIPREGNSDEEDGWVMVCVNDVNHEPAELVILDANDITGKPVARIHLPQRVPDGFHGSWIPDCSIPQ